MSPNSKLDSDAINRVLGIDEPFKAPGRVMEIVLDKDDRERVFRQMLDVDTDVTHDWFHSYFEEEQADRRKHKQDFTPDEVCDLLSDLTDSASNDPHRGVISYDPTAGTGGLLISRWWSHCLQTDPFLYRPQDWLYVGQEISDRAFPFLVFNMALRGMNAVLIHGDTLTGVTKGVFFLQNDKNDFLAFSSVNVMPYTRAVLDYFHLRDWVGEEDRYGPHVESPVFGVSMGQLTEGARP
ncbi:hypothetical protein AB656_04090 [Bifidobacterium actinocoloniiforme DSM 22766]|nr:hypothetical protein AB656_04090 [Bifidobacterium actinocoloniiforme DSM 22766]